MKKQLLNLGIIILVVVLVILFLGNLRDAFMKSASEQFIELIYEGNHDEINTEVLQRYKQDINKELASIKNRSSFQQIYFSLGKIASLEGKYEEASNYLLNAINVSDHESEELNALIYEALATNFIEMGDSENGYLYFYKSNEIGDQLNNSELKASLYSSFGQALIRNTDHLWFSIYLLDKVGDLTQDNYHRAQASISLASVYKVSGLYDLSLNELLKAFEISSEHRYTNLEVNILAKMGVIYFLNHQYEEVISSLEDYFELAQNQSFINYVGILAQSHYYLYGYESARNVLQLFEESIANFSSEVQVSYRMICYITYAQILFQENRYEECLSYLKKMELLNVQELEYTMVDIWIDMLKLDIQYEQGVTDIDYAKHYLSLLEYAKDIQDGSGLKYVLINDCINELIKVGDYETAYQYVIFHQQPSKEELNGLTYVTSVLRNDRNEGENQVWNFTMVMTLVGYVIALFIGAGVAYGIYRYNYHFNLLRRTVRESAGIDPLSRTLTKEALYEKLELNLGNINYFYFLLIDIDNFSSYNETFGYLAGDKVLKEIANVLKRHFSNAYISRHYGQQFIIVTQTEKEEALLETIELVMKEITNNKTISGKRLMTFCTGISHGYLQNTLDIDYQIKEATFKLRISKQRGTGVCTI